MSAHHPRPIVLLPPSKGKAPGGDGPGYGDTLDPDHPLTAARREILMAAIAVGRDADDQVLRRVAGVRHQDVPSARAGLRALATAPTLPAQRRYTGVVHGNAGLAGMDPDRAGVEVRIISALLGVVAPGEGVPPYRLEVAASVPGVGGLARFWREALAPHLAAGWAGRVVLDLLPAEHRRVLDPAVREGTRMVPVSFLRPDGRAANAARTKVAKGLLVAQLLARDHLDADDVLPGALVRDLAPPPGWELAVAGDGLTAVYLG